MRQEGQKLNSTQKSNLMGLQVDLTEMLGLPEKVQCPNCEKMIPSGLDDFDIECGNPNPEVGIWDIQFFCLICDYEWEQRYQITPRKIA